MYVDNSINNFMSYLIKQDIPLVFIHIPKTAGNAIITSLSKDYKIKHIPNDRSLNKNYHSTLIDAENFLSSINDPLVFTVVRNPWDRISSWFFFRRNILRLSLKNFEKSVNRLKVVDNVSIIKDEYELMATDFNKWLLTYYNQPWDNTWFSLNHPQSYWIKGDKFKVSKIIRYENLQKDIKFLNVELPITNQSKKDISNYKDLYTDNTKKFIAKIYEEDIDNFKYLF